jgi:dethiobiotin synthetase
MTAWFITGTGTEIGKTYVAARMIRDWRAQGVAARVLKPVASGYDAENPAESDAAALLTAMDEPVTERNIAQICPWRFKAPLSPDMAAAREGKAIPFDDLIAFCRAEIAKVSAPWAKAPLLIEGVGGVMVPLDGRHTVRDWIAALDIPAILIAGTYLGSISHTLTAAEALMVHGIRIERIILNRLEAAPVPVAEIVKALVCFLPNVPVVFEKDVLP